MTAFEVAKKIAGFAAEKKAENIVILNMAGCVNYCDYFVICSGSISRHVKAIADGIDQSLGEIGIKVKFKQGYDTLSRPRAISVTSSVEAAEDAAGAWLLLDMGDVVVHVFEGSSREFYALDHLWREAETISV